MDRQGAAVTARVLVLVGSAFLVAAAANLPPLKAVTQAVQDVDQNASVKIELADGRVSVESHSPRDALAAAIEDAGYSVVA